MPRGGKRPGAGMKPVYGERRENLGIRVTTAEKEAIIRLLKEMRAEYKATHSKDGNSDEETKRN